MPENLVEQVKEIEAEADRIVAEAHKRAQELEESARRASAALRREHEKALAQQVKALGEEMERRTTAEQAGLDAAAALISSRLRSLRPAELANATELILNHLRED